MKLTPQKLFSIFAAAEMITWAGLISALINRANGIIDYVSIAGGIHGFIFLSYVVVTIFTWTNQQWKTHLGLLGIFLSVIPFATVPFELYLKKKGLLEGPWRLAEGGDTPRNLPEKIQAWILRRPLLASLILLLLVALTFTILLFLGPPVPKN